MKTPPTFKVGDWVHLNELGLLKAKKLWPKLLTSPGPFKIVRMEYYKQYESAPSPWGIVLEGHEEYEHYYACIYEEYVRLDVFLSAVSRAVERKPRAKKKANPAQV